MNKVLQFSGGKDSLACLFHLRDEWDELLVMWCNTGAAYPETVEFMSMVKGIVPHFLEVRSNQPAHIQSCGHPSDVVPVRLTNMGHQAYRTNGIKLCDYMSCCNTNIWQPLAEATKHVGAEIVYRGQRSQDAKKAPIRSGHVEDGITYIFPIEDWTTDQVMTYLGDVAPDYYKQGELSSRDCWDCTAYLEDNAARIKNLPTEKRQHVITLIKQIQQAVKDEQSIMDEVLSGH